MEDRQNNFEQNDQVGFRLQSEYAQAQGATPVTVVRAASKNLTSTRARKRRLSYPSFFAANGSAHKRPLFDVSEPAARGPGDFTVDDTTRRTRILGRACFFIYFEIPPQVR